MGPKKLDYEDFLDTLTSESKSGGYLEGQLLIAMPSMFDPNFERTVIYICAHSEQGAVGLTINRPIESLSFPDLLKQLDIPASETPSNQVILIGGPVETERVKTPPCALPTALA
jgi:putative transcriptional regulator